MQVVNDIEERVAQASRGYSLSLESVLQVGFDLFRKNPAVYILYSLVVLLALSNPISGLLLGGPVITGYYIVSNRIRNDQAVELADFFKSFDRFLPLLILTLLVGVIVLLGLLLLIIPGIYFAVSYLFAHFFVWFYRVEPSEAIRLSRKVVSGNFGQILLLCLVLTGINMLGVMALGIGLLLTLPFTYCAIYAAFDDIIGVPKSDATWT